MRDTRNWALNPGQKLDSSRKCKGVGDSSVSSLDRHRDFLKGMNILSLLALDKGLGKAEHWDPVISTSLPRLEGPRDTLIYSREYLACLSLTPGP
jgi:hypothetical protein